MVRPVRVSAMIVRMPRIWVVARFVVWVNLGMVSEGTMLYIIVSMVSKKAQTMVWSSGELIERWGPGW